MTDNTWNFIVESVNKLKQYEEELYDALAPLEVPPESILFEAFFAVKEHLVKSLDFLISEDSSAIEWFVYENGYGSRELEAGYWWKMKPIKNLVDLRNHIEELK